MDDHVGKRLAYGFMLGGVILADNAVHLERSRKFPCQTGDNHAYEVEQVVLPCPVVGQAVAVTLVAYEIGLVDIVHAEIVETLTYR